jgi:integrase
MDQDRNIPILFTFYFGDSAASAHRGASRRLRKWSRAFDEWVELRKRLYRKDTLKQSLLAWRRLARQCGKMPWELSREDIQKHVTWMQEAGFATSTVNASIGFILSFYTWCNQHQVDPACPPGFNPAIGVARIKRPLYDRAGLWSRDEVDAFLDLLSRDGSALGMRDYAFFLMRLHSGVPLKSLQRLEWGHVEQGDDGVWVRWRPAGEPLKLPDQVWQVIHAYLRLSGRLEGMGPGRFIFVPLALPSLESPRDSAQDWLELQPLSNSAILSNLKLYGRQVGIAEHKLNLIDLRRTAIRMRVDQGESLAGMQVFMDTTEKTKQTKYRLGCLQQLMEASSLDGEINRASVDLPLRKVSNFKPGDNLTHGYYARYRDNQAVAEIIRQDIRGLEQETACLRELMRGLLDLDGDELWRVEAYSLAAHRLGGLIPKDSLTHGELQDRWADDLLNKLDEIEAHNGHPPVSQEIRLKALGISSAELDARGMVTEEIATIRLLLRNVYRRAMQADGSRQYIHLLDLYGRGCVRLARLLKIEGGDENGRLERYLHSGIDEAIRQVNAEFHK